MPVVSPLSHRRVDLIPSTTGIVSAVAPGSLAAELGIAAGDRIVSINDNPLLDAIDFQFNAQSEKVSFEVERQGIIVRHDLDLEGDEFWGITFGDPTFDGVRICENACPFCFIKQIPKGMRKSLYVMDDDFRYSMLYGAFVTLTNLDEADWQRIEREKISPMHVSVHATNPELRVALVGNPKGAQILDDLARLERAGIDFHAQLVMVPGVNDGEELDRERGVVIQEIARYEDQPSSVAEHLIDRAVFGEHPLGRSVLGPAEHLRDTFTREGIVAFRQRRWAPESGGAFIVGNLDSLGASGEFEQLFERFSPQLCVTQQALVNEFGFDGDRLIRPRQRILDEQSTGHLLD